MMIDCEAVFTKDQVRTSSALRGMSNDESVCVNGTDYARGALMFIGFAGSLHADMLYHGVLRFDDSGIHESGVVRYGDFSGLIDQSIGDEYDGI